MIVVFVAGGLTDMQAGAQGSWKPSVKQVFGLQQPPAVM